MDTDEELAVRARDQFRQLSAAIVVAIVVLTAYSLSAPTWIEEQTVYSMPQGSGFDWLPIFLIVGALFGTGMVWAVVVEHRRPWPFGKRRSEPSSTVWAVIPVAVACLVTLTISSSWQKASGNYFIEGSESWLYVWSSVDGTRSFVLYSLGWLIAYPFGSHIESFVRRRRRARTARAQATRPLA